MTFPSWGLLGSLLGAFWGVSGPPWTVLDGLGRSWGLLERPWAVLERSWTPLGSMSGRLGRL
eukprot:4266221-Pyramimonas_sp.AAC.1